MDANLYWSRIDYKKLLIGSFAFDAGLSAVCYPFWLVKTRQQASLKGAQSLESFRRELSTVWKLGGLSSIYRGFFESIVLFFVPSILYFSLYEATKFHAHHSLSPAVAPMLGATCAELAFVVSGTPVENIQTKVFTQDKVKMRYLGFAKRILKNEGLSGFYKGLSASTLTYLPAGWIWWSIYEDLKRRTQFYFPKYELQGCLVSALTASIVSTLVLCPFDVAKTRQMNNSEGLYGSKSVLSLLWRIRKAEGAAALFRGIYPRLSLSAIEGLTGSIGYEFVIRFSTNEIQLWGDID